jgi:hypothetical protein
VKLKLSYVVDEILKEQDDSQSSSEIYQFPHDNMTISVFRNRKILSFTPQFHKSLTSKIRTFITTLKTNFMVLRITPKSMNSFEVEFDPRQNFDEVVDFVKQQAENEGSIK